VGIRPETKKNFLNGLFKGSVAMLIYLKIWRLPEPRKNPFTEEQTGLISGLNAAKWCVII
jgi:hypothetical protein